MISEIIKISLIAFIFIKLGEPGEVFAWYQKLISGLPDDMEWLWKPLGGCLRCFAGQSLFWYYLIVHLKDYNLVNHLFYPALGIILVTVYDFVWDKLTE